jgi:exopolyphosphatase/guanosine-5'-triphosphate,3'-diphosphate pyrophosphatase
MARVRALLHDVGTHINYEGHHKRVYLIRNGERGSTPLSEIVAGPIPSATPKKTHEGYGALPRRLREIVQVLGALVRLAEGLDRSHGQVIKGLTAGMSKKTLELRLRTKGDAELELWAATRHAEPLAKVLGLDVSFRTTGRRPKLTPAKPARNTRRNKVAVR